MSNSGSDLVSELPALLHERKGKKPGIQTEPPIMHPDMFCLRPSLPACLGEGEEENKKWRERQRKRKGQIIKKMRE